MKQFSWKIPSLIPVFLTNTEFVAASKTKSRQKPLQNPDKEIRGKGKKLEDAAELTVELLNQVSLLKVHLGIKTSSSLPLGTFGAAVNTFLLYYSTSNFQPSKWVNQKYFMMVFRVLLKENQAKSFQIMCGVYCLNRVCLIRPGAQNFKSLFLDVCVFVLIKPNFCCRFPVACAVWILNHKNYLVF